MTLTKQAPCPCTSNLAFGQCCEPILKGAVTAQTAEQLLRARYTAFVAQDIDFVIRTHHPKTVQGIERKEVESWAKSSEWHGLTIVQKEAGEKSDTKGTIIFCAKYSEPKSENPNEIREHWEKSEFERVPATDNGVWMFLDAQNVHVGTYKRTEPKIGRNDPCPCGSGKKFKKCHAFGEASVG